jgi:hypothetical protein
MRAADSVGRSPIAWRLLLGLALVKLAIHALSGWLLAWGYMTDELYFLDSVDRLDWGFVDHPPLSIAVLAAVRALLGDSLPAIRLLPALLGAATVVLTGILARQMGGGRVAQGVAALAALACPVYLALSNYYSMNAIEQFLWPLGMLIVLRIIDGGSPWWWIALGVLMGVGLLNKVSMLWFGGGLAVGLLLTPERRWLRTPWPWLAAVIALTSFSPYVWWNAQHEWPFLEFSRNAGEQKVGAVTALDFALQQALSMGPPAVPLCLGGLLFAFANPSMRPYRPLAWLFVAVAALLAASGTSRPHYLGPAFPIVFAAGGRWVERLGTRRRLGWVPGIYAGVLALGLLVTWPLAIPLLTPAATVRYQDALGVRQPEELERGGLLPMYLGLYLHTDALLGPLLAVYRSLPPEERAHVEILTNSFGETGAVNVLGRRLGLPGAIGRHNTYWLWGPGAATGDLMIVVSGNEHELHEWFESCDKRAAIDCPYCMEQMSAQALYVCHHARQPLSTLWPALKVYR